MRSPTDSGASNTSKAFWHTCGFGCLLAWMYLVFFSRIIHYSTRGDITHLNSTYAFACCGMIGAFVLCAFFYSRQRLHSSEDHVLPDNKIERYYPFVATAILAASTVILALIERNYFTQPWCSITSCMAGFSLALLQLKWGTRFSEHAGSSSGKHIAGAFFVAAVIFVFVLYLPDVLGIAITAALPFGTLVALQRDKPMTASFLGRTPIGAHTVFVRALIAVGIICLAESFLRGLFLEVDPVTNSITYRWLFLLAMIGACLLIAIASHRADVVGIKRTNRIAMFALAFLALFAPIIAGLNAMANLPPLICYCLVTLLIWTYLTYTARAFRMDTRIVFSLALAASTAGTLVGTFLGGVLISFFEPDWRMLSFAALICACLIIASLLFIADEQTLITLCDADDERPRSPRRFRLRVEEVARTYGLSSKETEVFLLAAKGRTIQRIREELGLSTGTVNTHLAHIYKKLDIHDRQQMLDLLDKRDDRE